MKKSMKEKIKKTIYLILILIALGFPFIIYNLLETITEDYLLRILSDIRQIFVGLMMILGLAGSIGIYSKFMKFDREKSELMAYLRSYMPFHLRAKSITSLDEAIPDCNKATKSDFTNNDNPNINRTPTDQEFLQCKEHCRKIKEIDNYGIGKTKIIRDVFLFIIPTFILIFLSMFSVPFVKVITETNLLALVYFLEITLLSYFSLIRAIILIKTIFSFK